MEDLKQLDYLQAIEELEFIFEGATVPFIMLGETARRIRGMEDLIGLPEIEIAVLKRSMSDSAERTLRDRWGTDWKDSTVKVLNVPVNIKFVQKKYAFFENPDQVGYYGGLQKTANPFHTYWKVRSIIK